MRKSLFFLFMLFSFVPAFADDKKVEASLVAALEEVSKYSMYRADAGDDWDKLDAANTKFRDLLLKVTSENPSTLKYSFPKLAKMMSIGTSPDGNFRVYSWDRESGGTMHFYDNVYQFRTAKGVSSQGSIYEEGDAQSFVNKIEELEAADGKIYLHFGTSVLSTSLRGQSVTAFRITKEGKLKEAKVFSEEGEETATIAVGFDFFSLPEDKRGEHVFKFDPVMKTLSYPVVKETEDVPQGAVTSERETLLFDGKRFGKIVDSVK